MCLPNDMASHARRLEYLAAPVTELQITQPDCNQHTAAHQHYSTPVHEHTRHTHTHATAKTKVTGFQNTILIIIVIRIL